MNRVYLDHAAATPMHPDVGKLVVELKNSFANPSSLHAEGRAQRKLMHDARARLAKSLGAKPAEIIFTSGSTESAAIAIHGVGKRWGGHVLALAIEHEAVLENLDKFPKHDLVDVDGDGLIDLHDLRKKITDETALVCIQYVNNEIGTIQPVQKVSEVIKGIREDRSNRGVMQPLYLYCDAAQAGLMNLQVSKLGVDILSMGGTKIYGPPGIGLLYVRAGTELEPLAGGGGQESGLRSGTENVPGAAGMALALELCQQNRHDELHRQESMRDKLLGEIKEIPGITLNGSLKNRLPGNLNFSIGNVSGEDMVARLDARGFALATGSACTAASEDPSHVLLAIGKSKQEAESSLRITFGRGTTETELSRFAGTLKEAVLALKQLQS